MSRGCKKIVEFGEGQLSMTALHMPQGALKWVDRFRGEWTSDVKPDTERIATETAFYYTAENILL
jgi:hypothetical protein